MLDSNTTLDTAELPALVDGRPEGTAIVAVAVALDRADPLEQPDTAHQLNGLPPCRHCSRPRPPRSTRGLCQTCYADLAVRERYPLVGTVRHADGVGLGRDAGKRLPDSPTTAPPGSPGKIVELERRAAAGLALWHPGDAKADPGGAADEAPAWSEKSEGEGEEDGEGGDVDDAELLDDAVNG